MAVRVPSCSWVVLTGVAVSGCGTTLPVMDYRHAERDQFNAFVDKIAGHVRCEMRNAVAGEYSPSDPRRRVLRSWAAKIELTIRAMDRGQLNPDLSVANLASTFTATFGGRFQADATREMVMTYFVTFDELLKDPARVDCEKLPRAPEPITGDLGIGQTLEAAFMAWDGNRTLSEAIQGGPFDTITHRVSFAVQAAGSINPAWRLQVVSANAGGPFVDAMRTRTDQLLVTMGPAVLGARKLVVVPSAALTESFNIERLKAVLPFR